MKYAKTVDGKTVFSNGRTLDTPSGVVSNPSYARMREAGWKLVAETRAPSSAPEGKTWAGDGLHEIPGAFVTRWKLVDVPLAPPKVYSTADAIEALMKRGVYAQCREWIEARGLLDMMLATKEFAGDDKNFETILAGLQTLLGWTDEQVAEVLAEAEV